MKKIRQKITYRFREIAKKRKKISITYDVNDHVHYVKIRIISYTELVTLKITVKVI